jgi:hypothetical protein
MTTLRPNLGAMSKFGRATYQVNRLAKSPECSVSRSSGFHKLLVDEGNEVCSDCECQPHVDHDLIVKSTALCGTLRLYFGIEDPRFQVEVIIHWTNNSAALWKPYNRN